MFNGVSLVMERKIILFADRWVLSPLLSLPLSLSLSIYLFISYIYSEEAVPVTSLSEWTGDILSKV